MRINEHWTVPAIICLFIAVNLAYGKNALSVKVQLSNTPVLFKEVGKLFQLVLPQYNSENKGTISFTSEGKVLLMYILDIPVILTFRFDDINFS